MAHGTAGVSSMSGMAPPGCHLHGSLHLMTQGSLVMLYSRAVAVLFVQTFFRMYNYRIKFSGLFCLAAEWPYRVMSVWSLLSDCRSRCGGVVIVVAEIHLGMAERAQR